MTHPIDKGSIYGSPMTMTPYSDDMERLRAKLIDSLTDCYPSVEGDEGCAADLALDALISRVRLEARRDALRAADRAAREQDARLAELTRQRDELAGFLDAVMQELDRDEGDEGAVFRYLAPEIKIALARAKGAEAAPAES